MSRLLTSSGPFLFPCTIEYSLICAAVLFVMWKHIEEEHEHYVEQKRRRKISRVCRVPKWPEIINWNGNKAHSVIVWSIFYL